MSNPGTLQEDITYLKALAASGRRGSIIGGSFLAAAGIVFGIACFLSWANQNGALRIWGPDESLLWWGANGVFAVIWLALFFRLRKKKSVVSAATNTIFGAIWGACGAGLIVSSFITAVVAGITKSYAVWDAYIAIIFAFYGTAWFASAILARRPWMYIPAAMSFFCAFLMAYLAASPLRAPVMGAALLVLLTGPGFKLMLEEPRS